MVIIWENKREGGLGVRKRTSTILNSSWLSELRTIMYLLALNIDIKSSE